MRVHTMERQRYEEGYSRHVLLGNVDYTFCTTDNNCVSLEINFGKNLAYNSQSTRPIPESTMDEDYEDKGDTLTEFKNVVNNEHSNKYNMNCTGLIAVATKRAEEAAVVAKETSRHCHVKAATVHSNSNPVVISRSKMVLSERDTSQKQFTALKSRAPFFSVLKFETGAVIVVGLQDPSLTKLCVAKAATDIADTLVHPISITNVSIVNTVSTFNRFYLNFIRISKFFQRHCIAYTYNPETFPGMFFKLRVPAKPLLPGESLGEYYTKVALMRDSKDANFNMKDWMRVKTALTFKVGKNTVLGECGCDDVSVISKLLFGLFHYFMDNGIKMSPAEAARVRKRYGIPPLEWYLHVDMLFHSYPYVKPTREQVRTAMINYPHSSEIDTTYYGVSNCVDASMSANLLAPLDETVKILKALNNQKLCGQYMLKNARNTSCVLVPPNQDRWWENKRINKQTVVDPFALVRLVSPSESCNTMMNGRISEQKWWMDNEEFKGKVDKIVDLCRQELAQECIALGFIASPSLSPNSGFKGLLPSVKKLVRTCNKFPSATPFSHNSYSSSSSSFASSYSLGGSRNKQINEKHKKHRVNLARLDTQMAVYTFLNKNLTSGTVTQFAKLFGTDVYSLLNLMDNLPKSNGHTLSINNRNAQNNNDNSVFKTPGDAYFSTILDEKQCPTAIKRKTEDVDNSRINNKKSKFSCSVCGCALIKASKEVDKGTCQKCENSSTNYIESALSNINRDKKVKCLETTTSEMDEIENVTDVQETRKCSSNSSTTNRCTPSDFINSVYKFTDERTGALKVGLVFKVRDIVNSLKTNRGIEDRPTANYRTSLHSDNQRKTNVHKLLVAGLKENGASEKEAQLFNKIIEKDKGLLNLYQLLEKRNELN
uniref:Wsv303-like protein n=1 Tax=Pasiphaea japonica whispovirus TaxID=2984286 RepID=A0A9C7F7H3_9VIRU|nr:MAG: wsv303-like protein [Pasiphaea japonica whispovirus]